MAKRTGPFSPAPRTPPGTASRFTRTVAAPLGSDPTFQSAVLSTMST